MRINLLKLVLGSFLIAFANFAQAQVAPPAEASGPPDQEGWCAKGPDFAAREIKFKEYDALPAQGVDAALQRAYLNIALTRWEVDYIARQECLAKNAADLAKKAALDDFGGSRSDINAANKALAAIDAAKSIHTRKALADSANESAIEQFLLLKSAHDDPHRQDEAKKLAVQIPIYPRPVDGSKLDMEKALAAIAAGQNTADKAEGLAKEVKTYADDAVKAVLGAKAKGDGTAKNDTAAQERSKNAQDAWDVSANVDVASRLANDAKSVNDVAVDLALRAMKNPDPHSPAAKADLATAQDLAAQLSADKTRLDYLRTDALLKKLGIHATEDETLSVAKQRDYVSYLSVVADNPDAQALLGAPGVKLLANSGESTATLKLSAAKVMGLQERLIDVTISAPTTKSQTFIAKSLDGLAGGTTLQLTGSQYYLLWPGGNNSKFGILGGGAKVGHETHTYVDVSDFSETKDVTKTPSSFLAYAGMAPVNMKSLVLAKFEYQNAFKDGKSATECPAQATGPVVCQSGAIGLPTQIHKRIWSLEWRQAWSSVAVGATLSRDTAGRQTKVDVPVYFLTGSSDKGSTPLTGGLDFSWDTKNHAMFGLFIGAPFSVLDY